ncbi:MAG: PEGA domain-containing protein [Candidatus Woesearchaeota archaeon]|nr:PEGA domain-containing protein [Candidatus Woesearchaeota archaeon]
MKGKMFLALAFLFIAVFLVGCTVGEAAKIKTGSLYVTSNPSGAAINADGVYKGTTPKTISLSAGVHKINVAKSGYETYYTALNIYAGKTFKINVILKKTTCTDSDGGMNYYVKGFTNGGNSYSGPHSDFCINMSNVGILPYEILQELGGTTGVIEHVCDEYGNVANYPTECPNGCQDGACVWAKEEIIFEKTNGTKIKYVSFDKDGFKVSDQKPSQDNFAISCTYGIEGVANECAILWAEGYKMQMQNQPRIGIDDISFEECTGDEFSQSGFKGPYGYRLFCVSQQNIKLALQLREDDNYYIIKTKLLLSSTCTDSDGGKNYGTYGNVSYGGVIYIDACSSYPIPTGFVLENYCQNDTRVTEMYACPNGCKNGACAASTNSTS